MWPAHMWVPIGHRRILGMPAAEDAAAALLRVLAAGGTADQIAATAAPVELRDLAHQVHASFAVHRRRERELEVLVDTARDLASLRDPVEVLDAIVRRARTLLSTDLAYLTLFDPEVGDTYMRATAGSLSAAFQSVRLPLGAGLGGLVASTHTPYWTPDYFADERFRHTRSIDSAVHDEGIVAICGTPLLVGEEFVGVLFAADRSERPFQHDEVSLLTSFAALAAVTIVQARALEETETALAALSEAHETVRQHTAGVERAAAAHDRFTEVLLAGGGLDDVTRALGELLDAWVVLLDADGRRRSRWGRMARADSEALDRLVDDMPPRSSEQTGRVTTAHGLHAVQVAAGRDPMGTLVVGGVDDPDPSDVRTIERAAVVSALVLLFEREVAESQRQALADLISDLVAGRGDRAERLHEARTHGIRLDQPVCVAVLRAPRGVQRRTVVLATNAAIDGRALVAEHDGDIVALVPGTSPADLAPALAQRLAPTAAVTVAASGPVEDPDDVAGAHEEACRTLAALLALGHEGTGAAAADLGFAGLIVGGEPDVTAYVQSVLGPVVDYDTARGTELVRTLEGYFAAGGSPRRAASSLHVHTNTVAQRLDRISRLLGCDLQDPEEALEVQLALRLRRLVAG